MERRSLDNEVFAGLMKYVEPESLQISHKEELFKLLFENFQYNNVYLGWRSEVLKLMTECYSSKSNEVLLLPYENLNKIQLYNINTILESLCKDRQILDISVKEYWVSAAKKLITSNDVKRIIIRLFKIFSF